MSTTTRQAWARGGMFFAATMMLIIGIYQIIIGIGAIARADLLLIGDTVLSTRSWGWVHLIVGIVALAAGIFLYTGTMWARGVAIALAVVSALANFFLLPYYPLASLVIIALDVFVIWSIANARVPEARDTAAREMAGGYADAPSAGMYDPQGGRWPAENTSGGRHWAPDTKPSDAPQAAPGMTGDEARERASAAARSGNPQNPGAMPDPGQYRNPGQSQGG